MPTRRRAHDDDPASAATELKLFLETKLQPDDYADAEKLIDAMGGAEDEETGLPRPGGAMDRRYAMDSADPFRRMRDLQAAEREVAPYVGDVLGMDSAAAVFREALARRGIPARDLPAGALPVMWGIAKRAGQGSGGGAPRTAHDARSAAAFDAKFPGLARLRTV
jgi:hypothetical protein